MHFNLKTLWFILATLSILFLASCTAPAAAPTAATEQTTPAVQSLDTKMGKFEIVSARLVDEVRDSKAPEGMKFLLISLTGPDGQALVPGEFSLEDFQVMINEDPDGVTILGSDGSVNRYTQMGGWLEDEFVIGYTVAEADSYTLNWGKNQSIILNIEG
jgi:hypothetical protein